MSTSNSSKNALSHGAYSDDIILPWENAQDFKDLHDELRRELFPNGRLEEEAIFDLACLHWKKRRLTVGSQLAFRRDAHFSELADAGRREGWKGIIDYIATTSHDIAGMNASIRDSIKSYYRRLKAHRNACSSRQSRRWRLTRLTRKVSRARPTNWRS
jgi:hypothetical protein